MKYKAVPMSDLIDGQGRITLLSPEDIIMDDETIRRCLKERKISSILILQRGLERKEITKRQILKVIRDVTEEKKQPAYDYLREATDFYRKL